MVRNVFCGCVCVCVCKHRGMQSGSEMNRSGSLRTYLIMEYGEQTQRLVKNYGKELDRQARFANHHHFNLRCVKSGIVPSSLSFFLDRSQNLCFPSRSIRYGFEQSRLISQARGLYHLVRVFQFFISAEEAQYNLARNVQT